jgi:hypothetical protein
MTHKLPTFWLALILGLIAEGLLDGLIALFSTGGPCGFGLVMALGGLWHLPGMIISYPLLAMSRPDNRDIWGYAAIGTTCVVSALTFTTIFYFILRRMRRSKYKNTASND